MADSPADVEPTFHSQQGAELTVVIPTLNERENIAAVVERLRRVLVGINWEVVFVDDDSADGTATAARAIATCDHQVRVIQRIGRRGLASACVEGVLSSSAPFIAVMDADGQHDDQLLPEMLRLLKAEPLDIVVGSRYTAGGSVEGWDERRAALSRFARHVAKMVIKADVKDLMSGFFMVRRKVFEQTVHNLSQQGFKILFDLFAPRPGRSVSLSYLIVSGPASSAGASLTKWPHGILEYSSSISYSGASCPCV